MGEEPKIKAYDVILIASICVVAMVGADVIIAALLCVLAIVGVYKAAKWLFQYSEVNA